jgi:hypothetical protein
MSPSWSRRIFTVHRLPCNMPAGFIHATNPGMLFRVLSPALQLSLLLALLCNWRPVAAVRWRLAAALALAIVCGLITSLFIAPGTPSCLALPSYAGRFRSRGDGMGHGELRSHRRGFDPSYLGNRLPGPYLPRYRSSPEQVTAPNHWALYSNGTAD